MTLRVVKIFLFITLIFAQQLLAIQVRWNSGEFPMDQISGAARVELGSFGSFTPTAENADEWGEHWSSADATEYSEVVGGFSSVFSYGESFQGAVYMWLADYRGNWILLTSPAWTWPDLTIPVEFPRLFETTDDRTVAVVGEVILGSATEHLRSELVSAPAFSGIFGGWLQERGLSDGSGDADGDGFSNLEEFARGGDPHVFGDLMRVRPLLTLSKGVSVPGLIHPQVRVRLEKSDDLLNWEFASTSNEVVSGSSVLRPLDGDAEKFWRVDYRLLN